MMATGLKGEAKGEGSASIGALRIEYSDASKEVLDELVASAVRALKAQSKGEISYLHEVCSARA